MLTDHLVLLLLHGEPGVEDVGTAEEDTGQGQVVADEPDIRTPFDDGVVGAQILHPQETLSAQLDGIWHEVEHCNPDRQLDQHRQTA